METDPVQMQIELHDGVTEARDFLAAHCALFTFAERYGRSDCALPTIEGYEFVPTRQPVVLDLWKASEPPGRAFRTVGNFHQPWRDVQYLGEQLWLEQGRRMAQVPGRCRSGTGQRFELALSGCEPGSEHVEEFRSSCGFRVRAGPGLRL